MQDRGGAVGHRLAAGGVLLVRRALGVGGDESNAARIDAQLLRRYLDEARS
jgi:hypothetical protein